MIDRRSFLAASGAFSAAAVLRPQALSQRTADISLEIAPMQLEIAPGKIIPTIAYNNQVPGPLIRWPHGKQIIIDVKNSTPRPEIVHWHGQRMASSQDGAIEEGSPMISPGGQQRYEFAPQPAGFRWYHTHTNAGHNLKIAAYTGQFGCFYVEPKQNPGAYDQEIFLTLHDWKGYMGGGGDASMDVIYDHATINGRMLGHDEPIRVRPGQHVLFHVVNASATATHELALGGHQFTVVALDGNPVPVQATVAAIRLAPAERVDVLVDMNQPGIWIMGDTSDDIRKSGLGVVVEYAGAAGQPRWIAPGESAWDYRLFAATSANTDEPDVRVPLRFESKFRGHGEFDYWTINGKSYPDTDPVPLVAGKRYRLVMTNHSTDDHPIHLHRHTFEVTNLDGKPLSGLMKDVLVVKAKSSAEVDFVADNPGPTLFHCHQQSHMDFGFMMLFQY